MDPLDLSTKFHFHDGNMTVERVQDCTPILEQTKSLHNAGIQGSSELKHAARIPYVIVERYCNDNGIEFSEFMQNKEHLRRVLNDKSLEHFRVWKGRV